MLFVTFLQVPLAELGCTAALSRGAAGGKLHRGAPTRRGPDPVRAGRCLDPTRRVARPVVPVHRLWLIIIPLAFATMVKLWTKRSVIGQCVSAILSLLPVLATTLVLFTVIAAVVPQLGPAANDALRVTPVYVAFAVFAPLLEWAVSRATRLNAEEGRALAFSAATRNSLVVLPLALAVPSAVPILPAIIVVQTLVELIAELIFIHSFPRLGAKLPDRRNR